MKSIKSSIKSVKSSFKTPKKTAGKVLKDKNVLYIITFLAFLNIIGYLAKQNFQALIFFIVVGFLTTFFSKNMTIVLLTAMISTSLFVRANSTFTYREGLENAKKDTTEETESTDKKEDTVSDDANAPAPASSSKTTKPKDSKNAQYSSKEAMSVPRAATSGEEDGEDGYAKAFGGADNKIDYSKTLESAYSNLENILGKDGINDISKTTQDLMSQQKALMENMKQMEPFMKQAEGFITKMTGGKGLDSLIGGLGLLNKSS
jgi:hypothetical protein